jgi:hypothetical protein
MSDFAGIDLRAEPGWLGHFTRAEAPGAISNGTRIVKVKGDPDDTHALGEGGVVLGSLPMVEDLIAKGYGAHYYFVEWDRHPRMACGVNGVKIRKAGTR